METAIKKDEPVIEKVTLTAEQMVRSVNPHIVFTIIDHKDEERMLSEGATEEVAYQGAALDFSHDVTKGLLSKLKRTDYPFLRLEMHVTDPTLPVYGFSVDGQKNVVFMKNHPSGGKRYIKKIQIKEADSKIYKGMVHAEYPENSIRYFIVKNNRILMYEVSLISQHGEFFVVEHESYNVAIFNDRGRKSVPEFHDRRPQFEKAVLSLPEVEAMKTSPLPLATSFVKSMGKKAIEEKLEKMENGTGIVGWFTPGQKIGLIHTKRGDARVHYSQINIDLPMTQLRTLKPGDIVKFRELRNIVRNTEKSNKTLALQTSNRTTGFKLETIEVTVIG